MRQAGRSEQRRPPLIPPWGGESPKGVCPSAGPRVARCRVHLTLPCVQSLQTADEGAGTRASHGSGQDGVGERGMGCLSGRDGGEGPSAAIIASSATFRLTAEQGIVF